MPINVTVTNSGKIALTEFLKNVSISISSLKIKLERMPGTRYTKQIYQGEVVGTRPIGRSKKSWLEGVQDVLIRHRIKTSINKRAVQAKVMKLRDAQVEC